MKKSILNIGKALNKAEQKEINGGATGRACSNNCHNGCLPNETCVQVYCGPLGPFHGLEIGFQCVSPSVYL
jgi:hypothetical protein